MLYEAMQECLLWNRRTNSVGVIWGVVALQDGSPIKRQWRRRSLKAAAASSLPPSPPLFVFSDHLTCNVLRNSLKPSIKATRRFIASPSSIKASVLPISSTFGATETSAPTTQTSSATDAKEKTTPTIQSEHHSKDGRQRRVEEKMNDKHWLTPPFPVSSLRSRLFPPSLEHARQQLWTLSIRPLPANHYSPSSSVLCFLKGTGCPKKQRKNKCFPYEFLVNVRICWKL